MKKIIGIIAVVMMMSCHTFPKTSGGKSVFKIERTPCFGSCPVYTVELLSNKTIVYKGVKNVEPLGEKVVHLSDAQYQRFINEIEALPFADYKLEYGQNIRDVAFFYITCKGKKIKTTQGKVPKKLSEVIQKIEKIVRN
ncbi:MAG: hypothetical protein KGV44_05095 [Flavobacteriaceae bacterium]|nr:hypothetical protein [Flavobacteriaceae bacterium]